LAGEGGVEDDLEQQVAELLLEVRGALSRRAQPLDRLEDLVGLLQEMAGQRLMGLLAVPRSTLPEGPDQGLEAHQLGRHRGGQRWDPQAGEMVDVDRAVEAFPRNLAHRLVGKTE